MTALSSLLVRPFRLASNVFPDLGQSVGLKKKTSKKSQEVSQ